MHYRNGRPAKQGDKVVNLNGGQSGLVYDLNAQSDTCNGRVAPVSAGDAYINLKDCVHHEDVAAAFSAPPGQGRPT